MALTKQICKVMYVVISTKSKFIKYNTNSIYTAFIQDYELKLWSCAIFAPQENSTILQSPWAHSFNQSLSWPYELVY